jgi:hypothetical protein
LTQPKESVRRAGVCGSSLKLSPVTATGSRRICTGFPIFPAPRMKEFWPNAILLQRRSVRDPFQYFRIAEPNGASVALSIEWEWDSCESCEEQSTSRGIETKVQKGCLTQERSLGSKTMTQSRPESFARLKVAGTSWSRMLWDSSSSSPRQSRSSPWPSRTNAVEKVGTSRSIE